MEPIKPGDYVRHKNKLLNSGMPMSVVATDGQKAKCAFFEGSEAIHREAWFDFEELIIVNFGKS